MPWKPRPMADNLNNLVSHANELKTRLTWCLLILLGAAVVCYFFAETIAAALFAPVFASQPLVAKLVYTKLTEAFVAYLKMSFLAGFLVTFPVLLYHFWRFVAPGLDAKEKKIAASVVGWGTFLFFAGALFSYFVVIPRLLTFLMGFAGPDITPLPRLDSYLGFMLRTILAFGLAFQIPFLMVMARRVGIVSKEYFATNRKLFYIGLLILAFLLSAGEIAGSLIIALPLAGLYESGLLLGKLLGKQAPT